MGLLFFFFKELHIIYFSIKDIIYFYVFSCIEKSNPIEKVIVIRKGTRIISLVITGEIFLYG